MRRYDHRSAEDAFTGPGSELEGKRIEALKSSAHSWTGFGLIADHIIPVATPGTIQMDFAPMAYRHKADMNFYRKVFAPLGPQTRN